MAAIPSTVSIDFAFAFDRKGGAGKNGPAVDDDGAGTAHAAVAHLFGAGQSELELERALQSPVRLDQHFVILAVDLEFGGDREDVAGMRRGEVGFQAGIGVEILSVNRAPEIGECRGRCLDGGGHSRFRGKGQACSQSAAGDDDARALEKIPSIQSASFMIVLFCSSAIIGPSLELSLRQGFTGESPSDSH